MSWKDRISASALTISDQELKKAYPFLKRQKIQESVFIKKEKSLQSLTTDAFFQYFDVEYLPNLYFENITTLKKVLFACKRAKQKKSIAEKEIWLGIYFEKEITLGLVPNIYIQWTGCDKGYGLFALTDLKEDTFIGEYTGLIRKHKRRLDRKNGYCFEYQVGDSSRTPFTVDAKYFGNYTRFINHSYSPNLSLFAAYLHGILHIILKTNKKVKKDTELTYDYGPLYWRKREKPKLR